MIKSTIRKYSYNYILFLVLLLCSFNLPAQQRMGDGLGNHRATEDLNMNSKNVLNSKGVAIGVATFSNSSVALQVDGLDKAILFPRVTSLAAVITPLNGMMVYNTADQKFYVRQAGVWINFVNQASSSGINKYTTAQRNLITSPEADMIIFNTTTRAFQVYDISLPAWVTIGVTSSSAVLPTVSTAISAAVSTKPDSAFAGGSVISDGGSPVTARGVCWNTSATPTVSNFSTVTGAGVGNFSSTLWGLSPNTNYYVRAFAVNAAGTVYGNQLMITTSSPMVPVLAATTTVTEITSTTATSGGNVTLDRGAAVTVRGVCWATTTLPTIANSRTTNGGGTGVFSSILTGLNAGVTYYVRAYATNSASTAYGSQVSFVTLPIDFPIVTTLPITKNGTAAAGGGTVTSDGGAPVTARGVVWSSSNSLPTVDLSTKTTNGTGTGDFISALSGLTQNTAYYVRAYATNSKGTAYGAVTTFTSNGMPVVAATVISNVNTNYVNMSSSVDSDGGSAITMRGFVYNTTGTPTMSNTVVYVNAGTGSYLNTTYGFTPGTTYYIRSVATNAYGTTYGPQTAFTTSGSINFDYTGAQQVFIVPAGVLSISLTVNGATGGNAASKGGLATGQLNVTPGQILYVYVGGAPVAGNYAFSAGGFNGGGTGIGANSGGGGASDVRSGGTALVNRIIVAGGGGGSGINGNTTYGIGGNGGGLLGADGNSTLGATRTGKGGSQTAGGAGAATAGAAGSLGEGGDGNFTVGNGGGGGGYYGGGSGYQGGGGGGSGYIGGVAAGALSSGVNISTSNGRILISW